MSSFTLTGKKGRWVAGVIALLLGGYLFYADVLHSSPGSAASVRIPEGTAVTVYRSATCGCCANFVSYLKRKGFDVTSEIITDIGEVQDRFGVPRHLRSCHTSVIGDKVIEGHMPVEVISKFLEEQPDVHGIALPGMPSGSPGMPGAKEERFEVTGFTDSGATSAYMTL